MIRTETNQKERTAERAPRRPSAPAYYWLIVRNVRIRLEVLTLERDGGEEALPVFGHREKAEMFLLLEGVGDGWRVHESTAGELISVLYGPCASVNKVVLDPLPEMIVERTIGLVSLDRGRFVRHLVEGRRQAS